MEELRNGKRSTLQVVRVTCLAARVGRDAAALALGGRVQWQSRCVCAAERQADMGLLDLVLLCGRRSVAGGGVGSARHARGSRLTYPWRLGTRLSYPRYLIYLILGTRVSPLQLNVFSKHTARSAAREGNFLALAVMLGRTCMLLLLPAAARGQVEHVRQITNGTGLYCRGCAVLVEAVHEQLMATR